MPQLKLILASLFAVFLTGCAALQFLADDENRLIWEATTVQVIHEGYVDADKLIGYVDKARPYIAESPDVRVSQLGDFLREELAASSLEPGIKIILNRIIERAESRLEDRLNEGVLDANERVQLTTVLDWIEEAAQLYGGG